MNTDTLQKIHLADLYNTLWIDYTRPIPVPCLLHMCHMQQLVERFLLDFLHGM